MSLGTIQAWHVEHLWMYLCIGILFVLLIIVGAKKRVEHELLETLNQNNNITRRN